MSQLRVHRADRPPVGAAEPVSRLHRFPDSRYIGRRDVMTVYDSEDEFETQILLQDLPSSADIGNNFQAFAPDSLAEARNRGFKRVRRRSDQT
jgi:hypothetical protein